MTSNSSSDCDRMFYPEFVETLKYCVERFKQKYCVDDDDMDSESKLSEMPFV